jgi:Protein of unknown function (DUF1553)/Protein of unknown function (DUF1549)/Planctomycete cytochrome C
MANNMIRLRGSVAPKGEYIPSMALGHDQMRRVIAYSCDPYATISFLPVNNAMTTRLLPLLAIAFLPAGPVIAADPAGVEFFEKKVRPILHDNCFGCHSATAPKLKGGLRLDSRAGLLKGGDTGPAIVAGEPAKSRLVAAISYKDVDLQMPPKGKLPDSAIADLTEWIKMGAPWPDAPVAEASGLPKPFDLAKRKAEHWAWRPLQSTPLPTVQNQAWPLTPVDRFVLAKLESEKLSPAPPADRETLLRRLTFDLTGLPPTMAEQDAFLVDLSPEALPKVVDRLLASPAFGERWGRHWLDLVRYADTRGHEFDYVSPNAYQYRDYVIRALNADVPYNRFVAEQIAGDLLPDPRYHPIEGFDESVLGTGFWLLGEMVHSPVDIRQDQADRIDNMIDVFSKTFLGLTVACARCHDHKFDAISTKDYYSLFGLMESASARQVRFDGRQRNRQVADKLTELRRRREPELRKALSAKIRPTTDRFAELLRAAAAVRTGIQPEVAAESFQVDSAAVKAWAEEIKAAEKDDEHPLHVWAKLADAADFAERSKELKADPRRRSFGSRNIHPSEVIVDYADPQAFGWRPDDVNFGAGPIPLGALLFSGGDKRPISGVATMSAAHFDRAWSGVADAPGSEQESGDLAYSRAGRSLRTRSFIVEYPRLYSLVRGTGRVFACVDGYTMIEGPLHRGLVKKIVADKWAWIELDLSRYKGERVHVEFTAGTDGDFAVAKVVQAGRSPNLDDAFGAHDAALLRADSPDALAKAYQRWAAAAVRSLEDDSIHDAELAQMTDLLLRLSPPGNGAADGDKCIRRFADEQKRIMEGARLTSRLAPALWEGNGVDERVFVRGSPKSLGETVPRRFLEALAGPEGFHAANGSGRLELARMVTDPDRNPFLARVAVNRVWHHLFGRGIVASVDNFGVLGERPTNPELLDWLAADFIHHDWSLKALIRSLVLTRTYQMASRDDSPAAAVDPQNLLLHRANIRRLEGEAIRDAILAVSGRLDATMYGPPVPIHLTPFMEGRGRPNQSGPIDGNGRRSIYLAVRRNFTDPFLTTFDMPPPATTAGRRTVSNVPAQALILMNDPFVHEQAERWGRRMQTVGGSVEERIGTMIRQAFARQATADEIKTCKEFLTEQARILGVSADDPRAWCDLAHALLNAKEFVFLL